MYVGIFGDYQVRNLKLKGKNIILIRIFSENWYNKYEILNASKYNDVLELYINDLSKVDDISYLKDNFQELNSFILDNEFDEIIVHCGLGVSRSPAIMICIGYILNNMNLVESIKENYKFYNKVIVNEFLKYDYITKDLSDKEIIFDGCIEKNKVKSLVKENDNLYGIHIE